MTDQKQSTKPDDHKAEQEPRTPLDRVRTVTWEGESYVIDPRRLDDITFMDLLSEMDRKPYYIAKVVAGMLGTQQWERFRATHVDAEGLLSSARLGEFFEVAGEQFELGN